MKPASNRQEPAGTLTPAPAASGRDRASGIRSVEYALFAFGLAALLLATSSRLGADLYQIYQGRLLDEARRSSGGMSSVDRAHDGPVARIEIPRLGLSAVVREGIDSRTLLLAAGHLPGSAFPGEPGNVVIAGHRDSFFRPLKNIRPDDVIEIATPGGEFRYRVRTTRVVTPERTDLLDTTDLPTLTLVTCFPFTFVGNAPKRFIVQARQIDPPVTDFDGARDAKAPVLRPLPTTILKALPDRRNHSNG